MRHILLTLLFSGGLLAAPAQEPRSERYRFPVRNVAGLYSANFGEMRPNHFHSGHNPQNKSVRVQKNEKVRFGGN